MPNQETQLLDDIIFSRRTLLAGGGAALAALALSPKPAAAQQTIGVYSDNDILNFALNLEYLESNFYYLAAFGTTIDVANAFSTSAGAGVQTINGVLGNNTSGNTAGVVANTGQGGPASSTYKVPFTTPVVAAYAVETAIEEGKHVGLLRTALGSLAVAQPSINVTPALFDGLAGLAGIPSSARPFNPYASELGFLLGAYIFEDVGVSAYHGAAPLIVSKTGILPVAAGILAVEAYHAGLIRTVLSIADAAGTYAAPGTIASLTNTLSNFRNSASQAKNPGNNPEDPSPDDYGTATQMVTLNSGMVVATQFVDAPPLSAPAPATAFARNTNQVLNIVTAGGAASGSIAKGGFFPVGLNGLFI